MAYISMNKEQFDEFKVSAGRAGGDIKINPNEDDDTGNTGMIEDADVVASYRFDETAVKLFVTVEYRKSLAAMLADEQTIAFHIYNEMASVPQAEPRTEAVPQ